MATGSGAVSHSAIKGEQKDEIAIQRALLSVSDKAGLIDVSRNFKKGRKFQNARPLTNRRVFSPHLAFFPPANLLEQLVKELHAHGVELLSTGGTAKAIRDAGTSFIAVHITQQTVASHDVFSLVTAAQLHIGHKVDAFSITCFFLPGAF